MCYTFVLGCSMDVAGGCCLGVLGGASLRLRVGVTMLMYCVAWPLGRRSSRTVVRFRVRSIWGSTVVSYVCLCSLERNIVFSFYYCWKIVCIV